MSIAFRRAAQWADHVITISEFSKQEVAEAFGIDEARVTVVPLGYDAVLETPVAARDQEAVLSRYGLKRDYYLFVGTLQPRKNIRHIIEAHKQLPSAVRKAHPVVIVGRYGWGDDGFLAELKAYEQAGYAHWLNTVPGQDLPAILQAARAVVYPSLYEGFGLPVLEGFASRVPVITSNITALPEVAGDGALLVDPYDAEAIADAMLRVVSNDALAETLISKGTERLGCFSWRECARSTLKVYERAAIS
jgi:alpha-1,3-rhamnosyl/mannosyltransferase